MYLVINTMFTFVGHVLVSREVNLASPVPKYSLTFQVVAPTWGGVHMNFPHQKCFWFFQRQMNALEVATSLLDATKILQTLKPLKHVKRWRTDVWMFAVRGKPVGPECCIAHRATVESYQMFHFKIFDLKYFAACFSCYPPNPNEGVWASEYEPLYWPLATWLTNNVLVPPGVSLSEHS